MMESKLLRVRARIRFRVSVRVRLRVRVRLTFARGPIYALVNGLATPLPM